jgi:hypothetical protein
MTRLEGAPSRQRLLLVAAAITAITIAPSAGAVAAAAGPEQARSAVTNPDRIAKNLVREVNANHPRAARHWGTRSAVRALMTAHRAGYTIRSPYDATPCYRAEPGWTCPFTVFDHGQTVGSAWLTVTGPRTNRKVTDAAVAYGE